MTSATPSPWPGGSAKRSPICGRRRTSSSRCRTTTTTPEPSGSWGAHTLTGDFDAAAESLRRALRAMRELGSPPGEAEVLESLGELAERAGRPGEARRKYERALAILTRLDAPKAARLRDRLDRLGQTG
ncbi:MAG: tetratricopeptide repeat protein [Streptosporangiales bacterium]|nr:tetratricopeptide repeat protein [Streptosporangiales bacterium]